MSNLKRVWNVFTAIILFVLAAMFIIDPVGGYDIAVIFVTIGLIGRGISLLHYYFSMARFSVGGIAVFYQGLLILDAGIFALGLDAIPQVFTMLYLLICMLVKGIIDVLRANQDRVMESGRWQIRLIYGISLIILSFVGIFFIRSNRLLSYVYALSLIYSGISRLVSAFSKSSLVYIGV